MPGVIGDDLARGLMIRRNLIFRSSSCSKPGPYSDRERIHNSQAEQRQAKRKKKDAWVEERRGGEGREEKRSAAAAAKLLVNCIDGMLSK